MMGCTAKNKRTGQKYYLKKNGYLYYFSKVSRGNIEKPRNMQIKYGTNGVPFLKRM